MLSATLVQEMISQKNQKNVSDPSKSGSVLALAQEVVTEAMK
jgi:hypothetical protein